MVFVGGCGRCYGRWPLEMLGNSECWRMRMLDDMVPRDPRAFQIVEAIQSEGWSLHRSQGKEGLIPAIVSETQNRPPRCCESHLSFLRSTSSGLWKHEKRRSGAGCWTCWCLTALHHVQNLLSGNTCCTFGSSRRLTSYHWRTISVFWQKENAASNVLITLTDAPENSEFLWRFLSLIGVPLEFSDLESRPRSRGKEQSTTCIPFVGSPEHVGMILEIHTFAHSPHALYCCVVCLCVLCVS